jgi:hypothetical protein
MVMVIMMRMRMRMRRMMMIVADDCWEGGGCNASGIADAPLPGIAS